MFFKELNEFNKKEFNLFLKKELINIFQKEKRLSDINIKTFFSNNNGLYYILENQKEIVDKIIKENHQDDYISSSSPEKIKYLNENSSIKTILKIFSDHGLNSFVVDDNNKQLYYYEKKSLKYIENFNFSKNYLDFCRYFFFLEKNEQILSKKDFNKLLLTINKKCLDKISKYFEKLLKFIKVLKDIDSNENYNMIIINIFLNFISNINLLNEKFDLSIKSVYLDWLKNNDKVITTSSNQNLLKNHKTWGIKNLNKNENISQKIFYSDII